MPYFQYQGKNIFFRKKGDGPLLIILPGNTASSAAHENEINYFADRYCAASIDFLGTGKSDRIRHWTADWWEESSPQIIALINHLQYRKAVLLGVSGGAIAALAAAIHYPDKVEAVIADSFSLHFSEEMYKNNIMKERTAATDQQRMFWAAMHGSDWQDIINNDTEMIKKVVENGGRCIKGTIETIKCPVLLTYAENDSFLPHVGNIAEELKGKIRNCSVKIFPKGSHPLIWTNPRDFFKSADIFLAGNNNCKPI